MPKAVCVGAHSFIPVVSKPNLDILPKAARRDTSSHFVHTIDAFLSMQKEGVRAVSQLSCILMDILSPVEGRSLPVLYGEERHEIDRLGAALDDMPSTRQASEVVDSNEAGGSPDGQSTLPEEFQHLDELNVADPPHGSRLIENRSLALHIITNPDILGHVQRFCNLPSRLDSLVHEFSHQVRQAYLSFPPATLSNFSVLDIPSFITNPLSNNRQFLTLPSRTTGASETISSIPHTGGENHCSQDPSPGERSPDLRCILYVGPEEAVTMDLHASATPLSKELVVPRSRKLRYSSLQLCLVGAAAFMAYFAYLCFFGSSPPLEVKGHERYKLKRAERDAYIRWEFRPES